MQALSHDVKNKLRPYTFTFWELDSSELKSYKMALCSVGLATTWGI